MNGEFHLLQEHALECREIVLLIEQNQCRSRHPLAWMSDDNGEIPIFRLSVPSDEILLRLKCGVLDHIFGSS